MVFVKRSACLALALAVAAALVGCATHPTPPRNNGNVTLPGAWNSQMPASGDGAYTSPVTSGTPTVDPATLPGAENAGKPGYHTVRPGETIRKIATDYNQDWRDIIRWNQQLPNPDVIENRPGAARHAAGPRDHGHRHACASAHIHRNQHRHWPRWT